MKRRIAVFSLCLICSFGAMAQKVKYKDLFVLLNAKQYDEAEPFLRKYLKDNDDNPNAHLFMGLIFQEKSLKSDVLKGTEAARVFADSAIYYFELAHKGITEKEIRKNDEYYQVYSRRDLRTGEFGIKISDVHLDIEKRTHSMKERSQRVGVLKSQFLRAAQLYTNSTGFYEAIKGEFPAEKELLLRSDDQTVEKLKTLAVEYDSCLELFNAYKATLAHLGKSNYNQVISERDIVTFREDGSGTADFYSNDIKLWNYQKWALGVLRTIEEDVETLRGKLVAYDIEINQLREKVKKDSVVVNAEIAILAEKLKENPVKKFDPEPMPLELFKLKLAELSYASSHIESRKLRDTSDLVLRIEAYQKEFMSISKVDSLAIRLLGRNLDQEAINYKHFVDNAYGTTLVLKSLIKGTKEFAEHEKVKKEVWYNRAKRALNWMVVDSDSVPLVRERTRKQKYYPLVIHADSHTMGLKYGADSVATGYFYTITHSRVPDVKVTFAVDKDSFAKRNLPVIKGLSNHDEKGQLYFSLIYSETKTNNMFPATITKIYRTDGLAWTNNFKFEFLPSEIIFVAETGELSVRIASPTGENKIITIDKNGKQL